MQNRVSWEKKKMIRRSKLMICWYTRSKPSIYNRKPVNPEKSGQDAAYLKYEVHRICLPLQVRSANCNP